MSPVVDRSLLQPLLLLLISSRSFYLTYAQQQLNSIPTPCNQPLLAPPNTFRDNGINDQTWRQTIGNAPTYPFEWESSQIPQGYPISDLPTGIFDPSPPWRGRCGQNPEIQPPPMVPSMKLPNWPYYPWKLPECQQTPEGIVLQQDHDDEVDDNDDEEDVNVNFNTNTNSNVKDPRFLQAILKNLKGTVDEYGDPVFLNQ